MENNITPISEIFKGIFDRFRSPFFFSYLISFLAINWQTLILIFIYDPMHFRIEYGIGIMDKISNDLNFWNSILWPLLFSLVYTFAYPYFSIWISNVKAHTTNISVTRSLEIRNDGKLSIQQFIRIRNLLIQKEKSLEELEKFMAESIESGIENEKKYNAALEELNIFKSKASDYENKFNQYRIDGKWDFTLVKDGNGYQAIDIDISLGTLSISESLGTYSIGTITFFFLDEQIKTGVIIIKLSNNDYILNNEFFNMISNNISSGINNLISISIVNVEIKDSLYFISGIINNNVISMKQKAQRIHRGNIQI